MFKRILAAVALFALMGGPAWASSCPKDMKAIDEALAKKPSLSGEQMTKVKALRMKGEEQHKAGQHADSVKTMGEAKGILGIKM